ncbi:membrane protein DedA with SNARE-associated domain [Primorskyibacter sedentarius]|uniref:Membrane protein DedA with SNARE-associated domain n=1 Tax=Primorskyibacter sedentarius TaxID=745311 RepID=A0A4V2UNA3_9RHOB|nr:VTT domain-containing protein [Primorskyibacter sedentarius]TCS60221.1 membrane protein DedA with SNARE-associated domain [Primorskyibacter sedentarius]
MTETALQWLPVYGLPVLVLIIGLGCLGAPAPASLTLLISGSLIASGDFEAVPVYLTSLLAAIVFDHLGYSLGRWGGPYLQRRRIPLMDRARYTLEERGGAAVFLTRWLLAPLGPGVNYVAGAVAMPMRQFTPYDIAGEVVWVTAYLGLGYVFGTYVSLIAETLGNATGFLAFGVLAWLLWRFIRHDTRP